MWSDNIAERDYLGFDVHANLIKGLIDEPGMLPITIGVFGDWGSGKSSIMESLKRAYDRKGVSMLRKSFASVRMNVIEHKHLNPFKII